MIETSFIGKFSHIPNRYFAPGVGFDEKMSVTESYTGEEWKYAKVFLGNKKINKSSLQIAKVIQKNLGFKIFPVVIKVAKKGWDAGGGTAYFKMYGENAKCYIFENPAKRFKAMGGKYSFTRDQDIHIFREN